MAVLPIFKETVADKEVPLALTAVNETFQTSSTFTSIMRYSVILPASVSFIVRLPFVALKVMFSASVGADHSTFASYPPGLSTCTIETPVTWVAPFRM